MADKTTTPTTSATNVNTGERAAYLEGLWSTHVNFVEENAAKKQGVPWTLDWKGPCYAIVPADLARDMTEAMDFRGALVDERRVVPDGSGRVALISHGYRAHGF